MLKKLDELEEHPDFYVRTEEDVLLAPESEIKSGATFEKALTMNYNYLNSYNLISEKLNHCLYFRLEKQPKRGSTFCRISESLY